MSNPKTSPRRLDAFAIVCLGLLALYAAFLARYSTAVAGGSDSAGYLMSAKMLTEGRLMMPQRTIPELPADDTWVYTPLGMVARGPDNLLRPTYPIGLPLHFAAASTVFGWSWAPIVVVISSALAAVLLTFACARALGASRLLAACGAAALAVSPILIFTSIQPLSDTLSTAWNTAAFFCALRANRSRDWRWGLATGVATAVAVLVRPTDALIVPALCLVLWNWRLLLAAAAGGLPGALFLGWYQATLYGSPWLTGYGSIGGLISLQWIGRTLAHYGTWLPILLPVGLVALLLLPWWPWRAAGRPMAALLLWFLAFFAFFATYYCTHETWWYLRFVLPAFPALAIAAAVPGDRVLARLRGPRAAWVRPALAVLPIFVTVALTHHTFKRFGTYATAQGQQPYEDLARWANDNLPDDAAIATLHASCTLYFYTDFPVVMSNNMGPERFPALRERLRASGRPFYALLFKWDDEPRMQELLPGDWVEVKRAGDFALWRLEHR